MRIWSPQSQTVYNELSPGLRILVTRIRDEVCDITLLCGFRNEIEQNRAYAEGNTKLKWPDGKHNRFPSHAVDLQPHPRPKAETKLISALSYIAGRAYSIAKEEDITLRWGGDWDSDGDFTDQTFDDLFHFEEIS